VLAVACSFKYTETQDIEISNFADNERNAKLAENLMYYDPRFLSHKIPALDENTSKGIQLGYFVRSPDEQSSYRVTYNLSIDAVSANLDDLKKQFETYIPQLAAFHISKEPLFLELEPVGLAWVKDFLSGDANALLERSSQLLRDAMTVEQLLAMQDEFVVTYGEPTDITFVRAQYYEKFSDVPESVSLFYETQMTKDSSFMVRVSVHESDELWRALGFQFQKIR